MARNMDGVKASMNNSIGVVIVTFNRVDKLRISLEKFENQLYKPEYILVVNNGSTDQTKGFLNEWESDSNSCCTRKVINCTENTGGSGGFFTALSNAGKMNAEWIWVSDDDAYPEESALYDINHFIASKQVQNMAAICCSVINHGKYDLYHRRRINRGIFSIKENNVPLTEYENEYFFLDEFSYVGAVLNKKILNRVGYTRKDFFINQDDTDHSLRFAKMGNIVCVPKIRVHHDTGHYISKDVDWKKYYQVRNRYFVYKYNFPPRYAKFYYFSTLVKTRIKQLLRLRNNDEIQIYLSALKAIHENHMGMDSVYKPGWKSTQIKD